MNHGNPEYKERRKGQLAIDSEIFQDYTFSCDGNGSEPKKKIIWGHSINLEKLSLFLNFVSSHINWNRGNNINVLRT